MMTYSVDSKMTSGEREKMSNPPDASIWLHDLGLRTEEARADMEKTREILDLVKELTIDEAIAYEPPIAAGYVEPMCRVSKFVEIGHENGLSIAELQKESAQKGELVSALVLIGKSTEWQPVIKARFMADRIEIPEGVGSPNSDELNALLELLHFMCDSEEGTLSDQTQTS